MHEKLMSKLTASWTTVSIISSFVLVLLLDLGVQSIWAKSASDAGCFHNLEHTVANCSSCNLDQVPWGLHHSIDTLDLTNNKFSSLGPSAFRSYTSLKILRLRNNSISSIHADALLKLDLLHTLDLSNNALTFIPTQALKVLPSLMNLNMAGNSVSRIPDGAFQDLAPLKVLDMSGNHIKEVDSDAFSGLTKLQVLKMENNALRTLPKAALQHLTSELMQIHLYNNPWICDCKIRWLHEWMTNTSQSVWMWSGKSVLCDGPFITRGKAVDSIPLDELACKVEMRTSGSTKVVDKGGEAVLECIYFSIPAAKPVWKKSEIPIDFDKYADKYEVVVEGAPTTTTRLHIKDFQYEDITKYECSAENIRGSASTIYRVTLPGVDFHTVTQRPQPITGISAGVDTRSILIAVPVICGIIVFVILGVLIFCIVTRIQRRRQEQHEAVVENVKKHFLVNGGETFEKKQSEVSKYKLDQMNEDANSVSNRTNDAQVKKSIDKEYPNEMEPPFVFKQPSSPFANGNTYVSFGSEVTDPELPTFPKANSAHREGSQTESTTPLLDHYTPSVFDSDDPLNDSLIYPVYEVATLYHPRRSHIYSTTSNGSVPHTPGSVRSTNFMPIRHPDYRDYREMRYPYHSPLAPQTLGTKKSMSVGNLGHVPPPRKPPRIFHSREYVEMSPHDTSGSASEYMTVSQSPFYGIKPGTPV